MENIILPRPMQLFLDDMGWMEGRDERCFGLPSRSGMPRKHTLEDYKIVNELGRRLNMKICTALVLGEWDRHNLLRNVPNSSWLGKDWDCSKYLDIEKAEEIRDYLNAAEFIDFGLHGLLHDFWDENGERLGNQEYLVPDTKNGYATRLAPEKTIRKHLDTFFEIYRDWGFCKEVKSFASPGGCYTFWMDDSLTQILKDYGIQFWCNNGIRDCLVSDGIIKNPKVTEIVSWDSYDVDPKYLPTYPIEKIGIMGGHWLNLLRRNPENNMERLDAWVEFFTRNSARFGTVLSRDVSFAHYQLLYCRYAKLTEQNGEYRIDLTEANRHLPENCRPPLYLSARGDLVCTGGSCTEYEVNADYKTYKIENMQSVLTVKIEGSLG